MVKIIMPRQHPVNFQKLHNRLQVGCGATVGSIAALSGWYISDTGLLQLGIHGYHRVVGDMLGTGLAAYMGAKGGSALLAFPLRVVVNKWPEQTDNFITYVWNMYQSRKGVESTSLQIGAAEKKVMLPYALFSKGGNFEFKLVDGKLDIIQVHIAPDNVYAVTGMIGIGNHANRVKTESQTAASQQVSDVITTYLKHLDTLQELHHEGLDTVDSPAELREWWVRFNAQHGITHDVFPLESTINEIIAEHHIDREMFSIQPKTQWQSIQVPLGKLGELPPLVMGVQSVKLECFVTTTGAGVRNAFNVISKVASGLEARLEEFGGTETKTPVSA